MVSFVLGRAGSGKTSLLLSMARERALSGCPSLIIMPEQSSFTVEKTFSTALSPELRDMVPVTNFSKLARDVFKRTGGTADSELTSGGSAALVRRAVQAAGDNIVIYRRALRDADLCRRLALIIEELRNAGMTPEALMEAADKAGSSLSADKYRELALISENFAARAGSGWLDGATRLTEAAEKLSRSGIAEGCTLFFDGFSGFTEPQYEMIAALLQSAENAVFFLQDDGLGKQVFSGPAATLRRLRELALSLGLEAEKPQILRSSHRYISSGLEDAERWFSGDTAFAPSSEGVAVFEGEDRYQEAEKAAAEISYLVRERGWRYRDITVAVRNIADYRAPIGRTFRRFGIPLFFDSPRTLAHTHVIGFAKSAVALLGSFDTEKLLAMAGSPLSPLTREQAEGLENYCFIWNLKGSDLRSPFSKNPSGIGAFTDADREALASLEASRLLVMTPIERFVSAAKGAPAKRVLESLFLLLQELGAVDKLQDGDEDSIREASAGFSVLDSLYEMLGEDRLTPEELCSLISIEASSRNLSDIPRSLEEVTVSEVSRMRADEPRALFCMGLVEGEFPRTQFDPSLLSFRERDELNSLGGRLSLNFDAATDMEQLYLYRAVSAPTERLYLSRPCRSLGGAETPFSAEIESYIAAAEPEGLLSDELQHSGIVNPATALYALSETMAAGDSALFESFMGSSIEGVLENIKKASAEPSFRIEDEALAESLAGSEMVLSPTKVETYQQCPFQYFLRYTLGVKPLRRAAVDPVTAGSFVHGVLELAMKEVGGDLLSIPESEVHPLALRSAEKYINESLDPAALGSGRIRAVTGRLSEQAARLLLRLRQERSQSDFVPADFELKIGRGADAEPRVLETDSGLKVRVEGTVDRADLYKNGGERYLRVVDYKTGDKKFDLDDILSGLNLQMFIYLFSLAEQGPEKYRGSVPSGVLYMPADPAAPLAEGGKDEGARVYRMDGLVLDDEEVIRAMEQNVEGRYIPVSPRIRSKKTASSAEMQAIKARVDDILKAMAKDVASGGAEANPVEYRDGKLPCAFCDYSAVCRKDRIERTRPVVKGAHKELLREEESHEAD